MKVFQNIETKRKGLRCPIRVLNHSGDDLLTTYDPAVAGSSAVATKDLQDFWQECIDEFAGKGRPCLSMVVGKRIGASDFDVLSTEQIRAPEFDVADFVEVVIQPVPLGGG